MTFRWTQEAKAHVATLLVQGFTASKIGASMGLTRNAIIGIVARDTGLRSIGLTRPGQRGKPAKLTPDEKIQRRHEGRKRWRVTEKAKKLAANSVIQFPKIAPKFIPSAPPAPPRKPRLSVVSNNVPLMVQDWLAKNGRARKFCERETSHPWIVRSFLADRGVEVKMYRSQWSVKRNGKSKLCRWPDIMRLVDEIRIAEGLQPFAAVPRRQGATG